MIEAFIKSKIASIQNAIKEKTGHVSKKNRLVNSFFVGIDDHRVISPDNKLVKSGPIHLP